MENQGKQYSHLIVGAMGLDFNPRDPLFKNLHTKDKFFWCEYIRTLYSVDV